MSMMPNLEKTRVEKYKALITSYKWLISEMVADPRIISDADFATLVKIVIQSAFDLYNDTRHIDSYIYVVKNTAMMYRKSKEIGMREFLKKCCNCFNHYRQNNIKELIFDIKKACEYLTVGHELLIRIICALESIDDKAVIRGSLLSLKLHAAKFLYDWLDQ